MSNAMKGWRAGAGAAAALASVSVPVAFAEGDVPPLLLSQQGVLHHADDTPVTGEVSLTFLVYDTPSRELALGKLQATWWETQSVQLDGRGVYSAVLGDTTHGGRALTPETFAGDRWIAVEIDGQEMAPRLRLTSVPYALHIAEGAPGGTVTSVTAGPGLTGGTITGEGELAVDFEGAGDDFGSANKVARSDHRHDARYVKSIGRLGAPAALRGDVRLYAGANVTITEDGQTLTIAASDTTGPSYAQGTGITIADGLISTNPAATAMLAGTQTFTGLKEFAPAGEDVPFAVGAGRNAMVAGLNADLVHGADLSGLIDFQCEQPDEFIRGFALDANTQELKPVCAPPSLPPLPYVAPAGTPSAPAGASCQEIRDRYDVALDGLYWVDPSGTGAAVTHVFCDMHTAGGGWTLVLAYAHAGGTNDALVPGTLPQSPTTGYSHASGAQMAALDFTEARFYCRTSAHARKVHFRTSSAGVIGYLRGTNSNSAAHWTLATLLPDHSAYLPAAVDGVQTAAADARMTEWPFYRANTYNWGIRASTNWWACDDYDSASQSNTTLHQVWVRGRATRAPLGSPSNPGASCQDLRTRLTDPPDAPYWIDPDGPNGSPPFEAYCNMTTDEGGWTLIFSSQVVHSWADHVTSDTTYLNTLQPAAARTSVYNWPLAVTDLAFACKNRNTSAYHFYTAPYAATTMWPALKSCTAWNCGRTFNGDSGSTTVTDLAANQVVTGTSNWRWNLGAEGQTSPVDDFSLDAGWANFTPNDSGGSNPLVAWGNGDGGNQGRNRCAGVDLSTAGSQPGYSGSQPATPASYTSDGYFYIWVR